MKCTLANIKIVNKAKMIYEHTNMSTISKNNTNVTEVLVHTVTYIAKLAAVDGRRAKK